jgi:hypothetical protein
MYEFQMSKLQTITVIKKYQRYKTSIATYVHELFWGIYTYVDHHQSMDGSFQGSLGSAKNRFVVAMDVTALLCGLRRVDCLV